MKVNVLSKNHTINLAVTGLMGALVFVATYFFKIEIPVGGDRTMIGFYNVFCILSGMLLGPVYGGCAAGFGSFLCDIVAGWFSSSLVTLVTKFLMAFVCGLIVHSGKKESPAPKKQDGPTRVRLIMGAVVGSFTFRLIVGAVVGSLTYCALYLTYSVIKEVAAGSSVDAAMIVLYTKAGATLLNAVVADVIAVPLYWALRRALKTSGLKTA